VVGCSAREKDCEIGAISFPDKKEFVKLLQELREKHRNVA